jgi:putative ABC transport system substrate-binding protein
MRSHWEVLMKPREALLSVILALALVATPIPSPGQQPGQVYRIGWLGIGVPAATNRTPQQCPIEGGPYWQEGVAGLREHGYVLGQNLVIECRWTEGREERALAVAAELVSLKLDLIIASSTQSVRALKQATRAIPIVMGGVIDPVGRGLVASLAQPGGNVTGVATYPVETEGKRLQLLKEALPAISRVAVLDYSGRSPGPSLRREREAAARGLGLTLQDYDVGNPEELARAFTAMTKKRAQALFVVPQPFWGLGNQVQRIVELAAQNRLPAVYPDRDFVKAGGLLSYDVYEPATFRRFGFYVDRIFKGAKPADLPVEQPTKFDLFINLKTAKALGLTIPQSLLSRGGSPRCRSHRIAGWCCRR